MSSHTFNQFSYSLYGKLVSLFFQVKFGVNGAPTLLYWNPGPPTPARVFQTAPAGGTRGVASFARTAQGVFLVTLMQPYGQVLDIDCTFDTTAVGTLTSPAAPGCYVSGTSVTVNDAINSTTAATFQLVTTNTSGVKTDPASGEIGLFCVTLSDSVAF